VIDQAAAGPSSPTIGYRLRFVSDAALPDPQVPPATLPASPDASSPPSGSPSSPRGPAPEAKRPAWAPLTLAAFVGLVICSNAATAVWANWVNSNPEGLLLLSSRNRYLALTLAAGVSLPAYAIIAFLRIGVAFVVCHLIGRAYAGEVIGWFKRYLGFTDESVDAFDRGFEKAEWALIPLFAGSNLVAALSGVRQTPPVRLAMLLSVGIAGRLVLMWWLARTFENQLVDFLEWVARYQWWVVGASVALVVLVNMRNLRRR
jgi:hypothetical protein